MFGVSIIMLNRSLSLRVYHVCSMPGRHCPAFIPRRLLVLFLLFFLSSQHNAMNAGGPIIPGHNWRNSGRKKREINCSSLGHCAASFAQVCPVKSMRNGMLCVTTHHRPQAVSCLSVSVRMNQLTWRMETLLVLLFKRMTY